MVSGGNGNYHLIKKILKALQKSAITIFFTLVLWLQPASSQHLPSTPVTVGYRDFNFGSNPLNVVTETKPQSKLWYNDGFWWGNLFDPVSKNFRIHQFDVENQCWINVGPDNDDRDKTLSDALWDGTQLYIVSHIQQKPGKSTSSSDSGRLYRYSYDNTSNTYSLDSGFPVNVNNHTSESLVITKDSTGQLWVTWTLNDRKVWINRTQGDDQTWGDPFALPSMVDQVDGDDLSSVIAFGGNKIGVMWSNQRERRIYFAVHNDVDSDTDWQPQEEALADGFTPIADDHINLAMACNGDGGTVVAVTKTSLNNTGQPLVYFLKRDLNGVWSQTVVGFVEDDYTRPLVLVNSENDSVYVIAKSGLDPEEIYIKRTHLDNPQFAPGKGDLLIASADDGKVNNPTSTKQCVNSETGLLVIASDKVSRFYFHNYIPLSGETTQFTLSIATTPAEGGDVNSNPSKATYNEGESVEVTAVANTGYDFVNWSGDIGTANPNDNPLTLVMDQDRNITANFNAIPQYNLTISISGSGNVDVVPDKATYNEGESVELTAIPDSGYEFVSWNVDTGTANPADNPLTLIMDQERTVTANFGLQQFTLIDSVSPEGSGSIERSPDKPTYDIGESVILTASANETFVFSGWSGDIGPADSTANPLIIVMDQDRHVTANFDSIPQFNLTASVSGSGNITLSPDKSIYNEGETVTLIATPDTGYDFVFWSGDIGGAAATDSTITVEMTQNRSITANFAQEFTLIVEMDLPGAGAIKILPDKLVYVDGDTVTLTANPNVAFSFLNWSGDIGAVDSTENPLTIEMSEDRNIMANFAAIARGLEGGTNDEEDVAGNQSDSGLLDEIADTQTVTEAEINNVPEVFSLLQNYPNPFNIETNIEYTLPHHASVNLTIFNLHGRLIRRLVDGTQDAGYKKVRWNGTDSYGIIVSSGIYFVRLRVADRIFTMKILLQK